MAESPNRTREERDREQMPSGRSDEDITGRATEEDEEEFEDTENLGEDDLEESDR